MKKDYNNFSDIEKLWIREYKSWCKCGILSLAIEKANFYRKLLANRNIDPSNY
jgi:hypothetical protein